MPETTNPPDAAAPPSAPAPAGRRGLPQPDKRSFVIAGAVVLGIVALLGVVTTFVEKGPRQDTAVVQQQATDSAARAAPHIIPLPGEGGKKPTDAGERGGSLQFLLAGLLFASVFGGGGYLWWTTTKRRDDPGPGRRPLSRRPRTNG